MSKHPHHFPSRKDATTAGPQKAPSGMAALLERLTLAVAGAILGMAGFVYLAHEVYEGETRTVDAAVYQYFQMHQTPLLHGLMIGLSLFANGYALVLIALICILMIWRNPPARPNAISLLLAISGGDLLIYSLKLLFHRARPSPIFAHLGYSFPSGHAFFAVTIYGLLTYWLARSGRSKFIWVFSLALIMLIGFSRIYLGVHYASDVIAGFTVGIPWVWACLALPNVILRTKNGIPGNGQPT